MALGSKLEARKVFGEEVFIRSLNGGKNAAKVIDLLQQVGAKPSLITEIGSILVVECLRDKDGARLYDDADKVREEASVGFLSEFTVAALEVSGLNDDAQEVAKNAAAQ